MKTTVLNNQSLFDIAIEACGTINAVFDIAFLNRLSMTDELVPGQLLNLPSKDYGFDPVVNYLQVNKKQPATALSKDDIDIIEGLSGIDYWAIEETFIVS